VEHYRSYRSYIRDRFGKPVLKIPVNGGFSCPNRDGVKSNNGCAFCDNRSFSPAAGNSLPVILQVQTSIAKASKKFDAFIVYLQPFSNTYGSVERIAGLYEPLAAIPGVIGLAIGTRPDCFTEGVYEYLKYLSGRTYLTLEIGLQSANDETLTFNNRGHTVEDFRRCIFSLAKLGIETVAHVILGLKPENQAMMMSTAREIAGLPVNGVKIHQLMVIKGTGVEKWYEQGELKCLSIEEYSSLLCEFLSYLRPDQHIHRIMADSCEGNGLVAPMWSSDKAKALHYIHDFMNINKTVQGSRFGR
jgi:uncharacterized protein